MALGCPGLCLPLTFSPSRPHLLMPLLTPPEPGLAWHPLLLCSSDVTTISLLSPPLHSRPQEAGPVFPGLTQGEAQSAE